MAVEFSPWAYCPPGRPLAGKGAFADTGRGLQRVIDDNRCMPESIDPAVPAPAASLKKSDQNLEWLDSEMSGLAPEKQRLLEIAVVVTGPDLTPRINGPVLVIHQSDDVLDGMDAWNKGTHGRSGLIDKVKSSTLDEATAEQQLLQFISQYIPKSGSPMCGNTIGQDRRFLVKYMPKLEAYFHYRNLDVSTLKELAKRWKPSAYNAFKKQQAHTALADVHESIEELEHYRETFLRIQD
jgi:oligoribonuclease